MKKRISKTQWKLKELIKYTDKFIKDVGIQEHHFPAQVNMEQVRIKKYEPNNKDEFKNHVDVGSYASARRFLVFFLYLNDTEGGETVFTNCLISDTIKVDYDRTSLK